MVFLSVKIDWKCQEGCSRQEHFFAWAQNVIKCWLYGRFNMAKRPEKKLVEWIFSTCAQLLVHYRDYGSFYPIIFYHSEDGSTIFFFQAVTQPRLFHAIKWKIIEHSAASDTHLISRPRDPGRGSCRAFTEHRHWGVGSVNRVQNLTTSLEWTIQR